MKFHVTIEHEIKFVDQCIVVDFHVVILDVEREFVNCEVVFVCFSIEFFDLLFEG